MDLKPHEARRCQEVRKELEEVIKTLADADLQALVAIALELSSLGRRLQDIVFERPMCDVIQLKEELRQ